MNRLLFAFIAITFFTGCQSSVSTDYQIRIKGSESLFDTFMELKADFERRQDTVSIILEGGGSRTGLFAISNHTADIGLSSYTFDLDGELGQGHGIKEKVVGYDGIVIVSNYDNPIQALSDEQIGAIYRGEITNWQEITSHHGAIRPLVRDGNSGTQKFFSTYFDVQVPANATTVTMNNAEVVSKVRNDVNSIGFIGYAYFAESVKEVLLKSHDTSHVYVAPNQINLLNGQYPLKRSLQMYYYEDANPAVKAFLDYLDTNEAKIIIESFGLVTVG